MADFNTETGAVKEIESAFNAVPNYSDDIPAHAIISLPMFFRLLRGPLLIITAYPNLAIISFRTAISRFALLYCLTS